MTAIGSGTALWGLAGALLPARSVEARLCWRLDAGPKALIAWLSGAGCLLARSNKIMGTRRVPHKCVALTEIHLAGGIASVFSLKGKISDGESQKIFFLCDVCHRLGMNGLP